MEFKCKNSAVCDSGKTVPNLAICISEAIETGVIKNTTDTSPYTKETDVNAVGRYVTEPIDALWASYTLGQSMSTMATETSQSSSEA